MELNAVTPISEMDLNVLTSITFFTLYSFAIKAALPSRRSTISSSVASTMLGNIVLAFLFSPTNLIPSLVGIKLITSFSETLLLFSSTNTRTETIFLFPSNNFINHGREIFIPNCHSDNISTVFSFIALAICNGSDGVKSLSKSFLSIEILSINSSPNPSKMLTVAGAFGSCAAATVGNKVEFCDVSSIGVCSIAETSPMPNNKLDANTVAHKAFFIIYTSFP